MRSVSCSSCSSTCRSSAPACICRHITHHHPQSPTITHQHPPSPNNIHQHLPSPSITLHHPHHPLLPSITLHCPLPRSTAFSHPPSLPITHHHPPPVSFNLPFSTTFNHLLSPFQSGKQFLHLSKVQRFQFNVNSFICSLKALAT